MPSSNWQRWMQRLRRVLLPFDESVSRTVHRVAHGALLLLIVTGEAIRWVDYRETLISAPTLRAVHALAGFALASALLARIADTVLRTLTARMGHRGRRATFHRYERFSPGRLLDAAWWGVVGLLVASGLDRYSQLRYGTGVLPLLPPAAWWALHRPLLPFLYAILLLNVLIRGRIALKRALSYLYTP